MSSNTRATINRGALGLVGTLVLGAGLLSGCSGGTLTGAPLALRCGLGRGDGDVETTIQCFAHAVARQDAEQSCALLTRDAQARAAEVTVGPGPHTCVAEMERAFRLINAEPGDGAKANRILTGLRVSDVAVHGSSATARVSLPAHVSPDGEGDSSSVALRVEDGAWRLVNDQVEVDS